MKLVRSNVFLIGETDKKPKYAIVNRIVYRLEECDDEAMAEVFNGGDALPIMNGEHISPLSGTL